MNTSSILRIERCTVEHRLFEPPVVTPGRPIIVMLHEGLGSVAMWKEFPTELAAATSTRVVAYSRFGYGSSDSPPVPSSALEMHRREALEVLPEFLKVLRIDRPVLFGHSDGASIALIYAGTHPKNVAGLVVLAPHVFVEHMCIKSIEAARNLYTTTDMQQKLGKYHDDPDRAFWLWNNVWLDPTFRNWNIECYLPAISCPVLAIQGYDDEYGTMEQLQRVSSGIRHSELLQLEECRHSPHRDQPEVVLRSVAAWMATVDRQGAL